MQADDELALVKHTIMQGWPRSIKQVPHTGLLVRNSLLKMV